MFGNIFLLLGGYRKKEHEINITFLIGVKFVRSGNEYFFTFISGHSDVSNLSIFRCTVFDNDKLFVRS